MQPFISKHFKTVFIIILGILLLLTLNATDSLKKENQTLINKQLYLTQTFEQERNSLNETIISQDVIISSDKKYIKSLISDIDFGDNKIKRPQIVIKEKIITEIDTLFISFSDTSVIDTNLIKVPKYFQDSTKFYLVKGIVKNKGVVLQKISFPLTVTHVIHNKRYNLFYNKPTLVINYDNPYTSVSSTKSVILKKEPRKVFKVGFNILIFLTGTYLGSHL